MNIPNEELVFTEQDIARNRTRLLNTVLSSPPPGRNRRITAGLVAAFIVAGAIGGLIFISERQDRTQGMAVRPTATVAASTSSGDAYALIPQDQIQDHFSILELNWNALDPYYGYDTLPITARVHIDSIDGGRTLDPLSNSYGIARTFGKMTVTESYKGPVTPGAQLNYVRGGGIVPWEEYWKSRTQAPGETNITHSNGAVPAHLPYVHERFQDDVDLHAGHDYLVHLQPHTAPDGTVQEYAIVGLQFGLREIRGSGPDAMILNNTTRVWEPLSSAVRLPPRPSAG